MREETTRGGGEVGDDIDRVRLVGDGVGRGDAGRRRGVEGGVGSGREDGVDADADRRDRVRGAQVICGGDHRSGGGDDVVDEHGRAVGVIAEIRDRFDDRGIAATRLVDDRERRAGGRGDGLRPLATFAVGADDERMLNVRRDPRPNLVCRVNRDGGDAIHVS